MLASRSLLLSTLIVALGTLAPDAMETHERAGHGWGLVARTGRPFYQVGETASCSVTLFNDSDQDAFGYAPGKGGNGCEYAIQIEDAAGNLVWQPGKIVNGTYWGPGCLYGSITWTLTAGASVHRQNRIALIYQNSSGFGTLGAPLPPGHYRIRVDVTFAGPQRTPSIGMGLSHRAYVPFLIEP
jgi:hypothetical protein